MEKLIGEGLKINQKIRVQGGAYKQSKNSELPAVLVPNNKEVTLTDFLNSSSIEVKYGDCYLSVPRIAVITEA